MEKIEWIVKQEEILKATEFKDWDETYLRNLKKKGFSDKGIASLMGVTEKDIERKRKYFL